MRVWVWEGGWAGGGGWEVGLVLGEQVDAALVWLLDSFGTFFFTCCAVTDAFIVMISQETK